MNRATFGAWGAGLDTTEFAAALAAAGVLEHGRGHRDATLTRRWRAPLMRWSLPRPQTLALLDPAALANAWLTARDAWQREPPYPIPGLPRISVSRWGDPSWIVEQLSRSEIGPLSVYVRAPRRGGDVHWHWPLDIGLLDDPASSRLRALLSDHDAFWAARFTHPRVVSGTGGTCDLLLLLEPLHSAAERILSRGVRASCVLALHPAAAPWEVTGPLVSALRAHVRASGFGLAPLPPAHLRAWLQTLLFELSHDLPLDVALRLAADGASAPPPLLLADEPLLDETRLSRYARRLRDRAMPAQGERATRGTPSNLAPKLEALTFDLESGGASELLELEAAMPAAEPQPAGPRFIQAQLFHDHGDERATVVGALRPDADHVLRVRIGPPDAEWLSAADAPFPSPRGERVHLLTVVVTAPGILHEPLVDEIDLPPEGPSSECDFVLHPPADATHLAARVIVLHAGRVLQTATIAAPVGEAGDERITIEAVLESAPRLRLDDLDTRRPFDAALLVNHDTAGEPGLTTVTGGRAQLKTAEQFQDAVERVHGLLEDAVLEPEGYAGLEDDESVALLVRLANQGSILHDLFLESYGGESVAGADRLQLVALRPGARFPLEFVYDRIAPEIGAKLCAGARDGLRAGRCDRCVASDDPSIVCPLGFWGLTKTIERHSYSGPPTIHDIEVLAEPTHGRDRLTPPQSALLGASEKVGPADVVQLRSDIDAATGGTTPLASGWQDWRASVAAEHPPVLVLLPHTVTHEEFDLPAMEISGDASLAMTHIRADAVCPSREHRPVVILLGCNTGASNVPLHDFPPRFNKSGAAIVLGTTTKVLGRHAAPVAAKVVAQLVARSGGEPSHFSDLVLDLRRSLLADGLPFGMTLLAFGDGEWILGSG